MTWLRRAVVPLFAVCVALATGVGLGTGPLRSSPAASDSVQLSERNAVLADQVHDLRQLSVFGEGVADAATPSWLGESLKGRSVTLVALAGVATDTVGGFHDAVTQAGGVVAATVLVSSDYDDPGKKTYVESVADGSIVGLKDLADAAAGKDPYAEAGALVARAYVGHVNQSSLDDEAVKVDSELQGAKLVDVRGELTRRGSLAIVLSSGDHANDDTTRARHLIQDALVSALAVGADAVVVSTPSSGSQAGGLLEALDADKRLRLLPVSTINVQQGAAARVGTLYALTAALSGQGGDYGVEGSDVVLPPGMTTAQQ
ncbi:MAG: copper transporter [Nocardioidaceae bacterium]